MAKKLQALDFSPYQSEIQEGFQTGIERINAHQYRALYLEYCLYPGSLDAFLCKDYWGVEKAIRSSDQEDWAAEYDEYYLLFGEKVEITDLYDECTSEKSPYKLIYLSVRVVDEILKILNHSGLQTSAAIGLGFHDQPIITRLREEQ